MTKKKGPRVQPGKARQGEKSQEPPNSMSVRKQLEHVQNLQERKDSFANPQFLQSINKKNPFLSQREKTGPGPKKRAPSQIIEIDSFGNIEDANQSPSAKNVQSKTSLTEPRASNPPDPKREDTSSMCSVEDQKRKSTPAKLYPMLSRKKAYTLVYQKDIEISFLLLAKKELQSEQTLKQIEQIQKNELKIPKLEREIQDMRNRISELLERQNELKETKKDLTEEVVEIEEKNSVRATILKPYQDNFEDFNRKKEVFEKKRNKQKRLILIFVGCLLLYILISYPVLKAIIHLFK